MSTTAATRRHAKLQKTLAEYAETLSTPEATLKYWLRRGKDHGYPPPFDQLEKFPDWWFTCKRAPLPSRFRIYDRQVPRSDGFRVESSSTNVSGSAPLTARLDFSDVVGLPIEDNTKALRRTVALNQRLLDEAAIANDERLFNLRQRNYQTCFDLLRKAEVSSIEVQKARGQLIDRDDVITDLIKLVETLKQMRQHMTRDVMIEVEKNCPQDLKPFLPQFLELLEPAIEKVRLAEEQIFARGLNGWNTASARES